MSARPWTNREVKHLAALATQGVGNKFIAVQLGRTIRGVQDRVQRLGIRRRSPKVMGPRSTGPFVIAPLKIIRITKDQVPQYYELGWRFIGFDCDVCIFEWKSKSEPRWPSTHSHEVKRTPVSTQNEHSDPLNLYA